MQFEELWIGDDVYVKSKGVNGRWDGLVSAKQARIRIGEKVLIVPITDLEEARELEKPQPPQKILATRKSATLEELKSNEIDLHIEELAPDRKNDLPEMILNYQLKKCRSFIENCIQQQIPVALIIHGKGTGVLRTEVLHMLEAIPEVKFTFPKKDGGATEVWFSAPY